MTRTSYFVFLVLAAQIPASLTVTSSGTAFTVVFPENIAYYHPTDPDNKIWVTALHDDKTKVTVKQPSGEKGDRDLQAGETQSVDVDQELGKLVLPVAPVSDTFNVFSISNKTYTVTSDKDIIVQAFSTRKRSMQSALVIATEKLQKKYFIPPVPEAAEDLDDGLVVNVTERGPFRVIVVNPGPGTANVTIGEEGFGGLLGPEKVAQIWVSNAERPLFVQSDQPVAVYFSHPCAARSNCTCGLLHALVPPAQNRTVTFPIPTVLAENASILLSDEDSRKTETDKSVVSSAGTAMLYRPDTGLLLTLIPEEEFASCFVVPFIQNKNNYISIVVHKDHKEGIHIGNDPLGHADWKEVPGSTYTSTFLNASDPKTVIWHSSSKMAVYFLATFNGSWFGNPAAAVGATPDFRGCAVVSEELKVLDAPENWKNSIGSCKTNHLDLISLSSDQLQNHTCRKLQEAHGDVQDVWIGSRRSSYFGDWYWLNNSTSSYSNWGPGEPGEVDEGQCVAMSLKDSSDCVWKDENCCKNLRPVCYKEPIILTG